MICGGLKNSEKELEKFKEEYRKVQIAFNLINDKSEQITFNDFGHQLRKLLTSIDKLVIDPINFKLSKIIDSYKENSDSSLLYDQIGDLREYLNSKIYENSNKYEPINDNFISIYEAQKKEQGISLLCNELDKRTGGINPGKICTIVGGPGSMKTTYATNICYEAIKNGKNVCFLSLEETPFDIYSKLLSRTSVDLEKKISVQNITQHRLDKEESTFLKEKVYDYLEKLPGTFTLLGSSDLGNLDVGIIEHKLKLVDKLVKEKTFNKQAEENHGIDIVVVDHIQMFKYVVSKYKDEFQVMNSYVSFFRNLSKEFLSKNRQVSIILLSQCNREGISFAKNHDGQYSMHHVAEASEIERSSSYIISVYTDAMSQISKLLKIGAVKLRGAALPLSTINVFADGEYYQVGQVNQPLLNEYSMDDVCSNLEAQQESIDLLDDIMSEKF